MFETRVKKVNQKKTNQSGRVVVYIMSRDQRAKYNHALLVATEQAQELQLPIVVVFQLYPKVTNRYRQHYQFMLEGLKETVQFLDEKGIPFLVLSQDQNANIQYLQEKLEPAAVYFDFSPLKKSTALREKVGQQLACAVYTVDTHNVVPMWEVSDKQEYNAYFFRRKHHQYWDQYLRAPEMKLQQSTSTAIKSNFDYQDLSQQVQASHLPNYNPIFNGGYSQAQHYLDVFLEKKLLNYGMQRNDPNADILSNLSPYLHFGQISSLEIALAVQDYSDQARQQLSDSNIKQLNDSADGFLEELLVRKELSDNYCYHNNHYKSIEGVADWAQKTLAEHSQDEREYLYDLEQLEQAQTHDDAWNAAQKQMMQTGKMHGYMRMYWAKKILEWTPSAQTAVDIAIKLNDTYNLDGYDPNGYVGILWSIGGLHDRAWQERKVFGKIRYMSYGGLKRKFDVKQYIDCWL